MNYTEATKDPLRIVVRDSLGYFMIGPSVKGEYKTFFHSALEENVKERGFCLSAGGAGESGALGPVHRLQGYEGVTGNEKALVPQWSEIEP